MSDRCLLLVRLFQLASPDGHILRWLGRTTPIRGSLLNGPDKQEVPSHLRHYIRAEEGGLNAAEL
jgi:hypothetical protein